MIGSSTVGTNESASDPLNKRQIIFAAYQVGRGGACGGILLDQETGTFSTIAMRRWVDHCWTCVAKSRPFAAPEQALDALSIDMRGGDPPEPLALGVRRRPLLIEVGPRGSSPEFDLLIKSMSHLPALMAVGECYLALPRPDRNFISDLQTNNFASRLFELYLLACLPAFVSKVCRSAKITSRPIFKSRRTA